MPQQIFENLGIALEATRGTAIAAPTKRLLLEGQVNPQKETYRPSESNGMSVEATRSAVVRKWAEWEASGALDPTSFHTLMAMLVNGTVSAPTTPAGGTLSRLWTFTPAMTGDDLKTATLFWGDPTTFWQAKFGFIDELSISAETSGTDAVQMDLSGQTNTLTTLAIPALPAITTPPLLIPSLMNVYIDNDATAYGTTDVTTRVYGVEVTLPTGLNPDFTAQGPTSNLSYTKLGREKRHLTLNLTMDVANLNQFTQWENGSRVRVRVRFNGPIIEGALRYYVEFNACGVFDTFEWSTSDGGERTAELELFTEYDALLSADWQVITQNISTTL